MKRLFVFFILSFSIMFFACNRKENELSFLLSEQQSGDLYLYFKFENLSNKVLEIPYFSEIVFSKKQTWSGDICGLKLFLNDDLLNEKDPRSASISFENSLMSPEEYSKCDSLKRVRIQPKSTIVFKCRLINSDKLKSIFISKNVTTLKIQCSLFPRLVENGKMIFTQEYNSNPFDLKQW